MAANDVMMAEIVRTAVNTEHALKAVAAAIEKQTALLLSIGEALAHRHAETLEHVARLREMGEDDYGPDEPSAQDLTSKQREMPPGFDPEKMFQEFIEKNGGIGGLIQK